MKLVPVMVTVTGLEPPTTMLAGETEMAYPGAGFHTETLAAEEVPPPGVAFTAVRASEPPVATSASDNVTLTCLLVTYAVVRELPLTLITVVGTNPVPTTEITGEVAPAAKADGETPDIAGAGLSISRFTGAPEPLLIDPLSAITASWPPLVSCVADTVASTFVALT